MAIRQSSAFQPGGIATASAYASGDAVGDIFEIREVNGFEGGIINEANLYDRGTASGALRLHLFSKSASGTPNGDTYAIANADQAYHLGYIDYNTTWISANAATLMTHYSGFNGKKVGFISSVDGARSVFGQFQAKGAMTFGATANPLLGTVIVLGD